MHYRHCCGGTRPSHPQTSKFMYFPCMVQSLITFPRRFVDRIRRFCMGSGCARAKYSSRLLCYMKEKEDLRAEVVEVGLPFAV